MPTPIEQLKAEHRIIEKALNGLSGLCDRLERGEAVEPAGFDRLLEFLGKFADLRHHQKEEKCLFPALGLHGVARDRGPIGVMLQEHCTGRALIAHMKRAATAYENHSPNAAAQFADSARNYVTLLREHIAKEDSVLFRIAEGLLDEHALRSLQDEFETLEADLVESHAKYGQLAEEMEREWAIPVTDEGQSRL